MRILLRLALLLIVACGSSRPQPVEVAKPRTTTTTTIHAAASGNYPPFSAWTDHGPEGFAPALLGSFAKSERAEVAWTRFGWPDLFADMRAGKMDLAADGITVTPKRSIAGRFTVPVARGGAVLLLRRPSWLPAGERADVHALDRTELRIVVNAGGHLEQVTRTLFHAAHIQTFSGNVGLRDALARGDADAAMTNTFEAPRWAEGLTGVERVGPLGSDFVAFWVAPKQGELAEHLDAFLLAEESRGALAALRTSTLGSGAGPATARPLPALFAATRERLSLMPIVAAVKKRAGRPVTDPRQEERVIAAAKETVAKAAKAAGRSPPSPARIEAFFRAQIEAAKSLEEHPATDDESVTYSLDDDLRPAIARISARLAFLLVRLPHGTTFEVALAEAREDLDDLPLDAKTIEAIAHAVAELTLD